jgi:hypothetical protein
MSIREINQRWLATMGLDDESRRLLAEIRTRVDRIRATYGARPPWWRLLARRRWDREVAGAEQRVLDRMRSELAAAANLDIGMRVITTPAPVRGVTCRWSGLAGRIVDFPSVGDVRVQFDDGSAVTCAPDEVTPIPGSTCTQPA